MTKHMFAGANTPSGFIDFFDHIMPLEKASRRYFLKGSSGSGKSTFIKKIAAEFKAIGVDTEKFHCANDSDSLDALSINSKGICIMDATAPHNRDPEMPIAVDKIIDFANFIDKNKINKYVDEIKSLLIRKKQLNDKVSSHLTIVKKIYTDEYKIYQNALDTQSLNELVQEWLKLLNINSTPNPSILDRKLFLSAITPDGFISFAKNHFNDCKIYGLQEDSKIAADNFMSIIRNKANACGVYTESFYSPFEPQILDYLYFPNMKIAFAATSKHMEHKGNIENKIDINHCYNTKILKNANLEINQHNKHTHLDKALAVAVNSMYSSRTVHTKIEEIYSSTINFDEVNKLTEKILNEIL